MAPKSRAYWIACYAILAVYGVFTLLPIAYLIVSSFKTQQQIYDGVASTFWFTPTLDSYRFIFETKPILQMLTNTAIVSVGSTLFSLVFGTIAAYGLARYKFRGRDDLAFYILSIRMFPPIVAALPIFMIFNSLDLLDSKIGLIIAYTSFNLPFVVWMMTGFIKSVPVQLEEAAMVDGQSQLGAIRDILIPVLRPSILAVGIFCIIFSWNEFLFALILTKSQAKTLPVAIPEFITWTEVGWNYVAAAGMVLVAPVLVFSFLAQRYMVRGMSMGAIKD
ncbi:carbohydrate ABC transporter permease [Mesorhizobium sp. KR9-304]|uniref:carbohydrate ABC transporter permease n=1 Tax=Mesorhizobium sp. KR9-304 TaxID=3156614 RepID=UPI0032B50D41